jgi:hypothetical protein
VLQALLRGRRRFLGRVFPSFNCTSGVKWLGLFGPRHGCGIALKPEIEGERFGRLRLDKRLRDPSLRSGCQQEQATAKAKSRFLRFARNDKQENRQRQEQRQEQRQRQNAGVLRCAQNDTVFRRGPGGGGYLGVRWMVLRMDSRWVRTWSSSVGVM